MTQAFTFAPAARRAVKLKPEEFRALHLKAYAGRPACVPVVIDENGCWIWQGRLTDNGYGLRNKRVVHREAWEEANGPVPDGMDLDHLCRVRRCCNPEHLEVVTRTTNLRRGLGKGPTHHSTKLSAEALTTIRAERVAGTASLGQLARRFGVTKQAIALVMRRTKEASV